MDEFGFDLDDAQMFSALMENMADSIYFKDRMCRLIRISHKMAENLGVQPGEIIGKTDEDLFGQEFGARTRRDDLKVMETGEPIIGLVESNRRTDGSINWTSTTKIPVRNPNGEIIGLLGITREINELKKTELELQFLATHDLLTSLPNRYFFFQELQQLILRARRHPHPSAILYVDIDHFKDINDQYGHDAGDEALQKIANLMQSAIRDDDLVARLGGDEFVIMLDYIQSPLDASAVAERIIEGFYQDFTGNIRLTPSIGISIFPNDSENPRQLVKFADQAMYEAKNTGNAYKFYIRKME
jgi:diguanylate cyclase (GGDEF)-like protein/PAS domain S-box-containing protein